MLFGEIGNSSFFRRTAKTMPKLPDVQTDLNLHLTHMHCYKEPPSFEYHIKKIFFAGCGVAGRCLRALFFLIISNTKRTACISYRNHILVTFYGKIGSWISKFYFYLPAPTPTSPLHQMVALLISQNLFFFGYHTGKFKLNDDITKTGFV